MTTTPPKHLRVSFVIDAASVGDFMFAYADKVQALEIVAVERVPHNKNKPGLTTARAQGKEIRNAVEALLAEGPLSRNDLVSRLSPTFDAAAVRQVTYNMLSKERLTKTKKGTLALAGAGASKNGVGANAAGN